MASKYADDIHDLAAGTVGGVLGVLSGAPIDFLRVRLQSPQFNYNGPIDAARTVIRKEGFGAFFKGILPPLISNVPINAICFAGYANAYRYMNTSAAPSYLHAPSFTPAQVPRPTQEMKDQLLDKLQREVSPSLTKDYMESNTNYVSVAEQPNMLARFIAGCWAGLLQAPLSNISEFLKIQEQNVEGALNKGSFQFSIDVIKQQGLLSVFRGHIACIWRDVPSIGVYFLVYEYIKWVLRKDTFTMVLDTKQPTSSAFNALPLNITWQHDYDYSALTMLAAGGLAGSIGWLSTYPLDVIKTHIQSLPVDRYKKEGKMLYAARHILREKGWRFFFTGCTTSVVGALPVNAITFLAYEETLKFCKRNYWLMEKPGSNANL